MRSRDSININVAAITSFSEVLSELRLLEEKLSQNNLSHFNTFNKAYHIVTSTIKEAAEDNYFENPVFIEKFTVCFAQYYFQAINDTVSESPELPVAWAKMSDATRMNSLPVFISLIMGANAHINHDLTLALVKFMDEEKTDYSLHDVRRVDKLLMKSGRQILETFDESTKLLNVMKRRFRFLYFHPVMYTILYWRVIAWRNYRVIKVVEGLRPSHEERSVKIANRLLKLGNFLS